MFAGKYLIKLLHNRLCLPVCVCVKQLFCHVPGPVTRKMTSSRRHCFLPPGSPRFGAHGIKCWPLQTPMTPSSGETVMTASRSSNPNWWRDSASPGKCSPPAWCMTQEAPCIWVEVRPWTKSQASQSMVRTWANLGQTMVLCVSAMWTQKYRHDQITASLSHVSAMLTQTQAIEMTKSQPVYGTYLLCGLKPRL